MNLFPFWHASPLDEHRALLHERGAAQGSSLRCSTDRVLKAVLLFPKHANLQGSDG